MKCSPSLKKCSTAWRSSIRDSVFTATFMWTLLPVTSLTLADKYSPWYTVPKWPLPETSAIRYRSRHRCNLWPDACNQVKLSLQPWRWQKPLRPPGFRATSRQAFGIRGTLSTEIRQRRLRFWLKIRQRTWLLCNIGKILARKLPFADCHHHHYNANPDASSTRKTKVSRNESKYIWIENTAVNSENTSRCFLLLCVRCVTAHYSLSYCHRHTQLSSVTECTGPVRPAFMTSLSGLYFAEAAKPKQTCANRWVRRLSAAHNWFDWDKAESDILNDNCAPLTQWRN